MTVESHKWWSSHLEQRMELKHYGRHGKAVIAFPTSTGGLDEYEEQGMIEACKSFIEAGEIQLFTVDSIDDQSWLNSTIHPDDRGERYVAYDSYIIEEVLPFIYAPDISFQKVMVTGCDIGALHAANCFFKHPDKIDTVVALSGMYSSHYFLGDYMSEHVYYHFPLAYLPNLDDPWYLQRYQDAHIIFCVGRGGTEQDSLKDTWAMKKLLDAKRIPAWIDFWGGDVTHDWYWWHKQLVYFLKSLPFTEHHAV